MNDRETDVAPQARDGRNIDQTLGSLRGEGAQQRIGFLRPSYEPTPGPREETSYYGLPLLKSPVWRWYVPAYFYTGGLAGGAAALGAAAMLRGGELRAISDVTRWISAAGAAVSGVLLIADLGRPERFLYMMRVFRPSSPMNLGTWIFSAFGAAATASLLFPRAAIAAGILGVPMAGYTAVLVTNTAVPVWLSAQTMLPPLFLASALTAAASALEVLPLDGASRKVVRRAAIAGKVAELVAGFAVRRETGAAGRALEHGVPGALWNASKALTAASLFFSAFTRRRKLAGALGTLGSLALRFAIVHAGRSSTRDPHATFAQQT